MFAHFMVGDLQAHLPTCAQCSAVFDQRWGNPMPHPPCSLNFTPRDFFLFPWVKKVFKGKHFADVKEMKQKTAEALKDIKIGEFQNCCEQWKKVSISVLHQTESTLKGTEN